MDKVLTELDSALAIDICDAAVASGQYPLITKVLDNFRPNRQDILVLVTKAIQDGDMSTIQAVAKSQVDYLMHFNGPIMTMWLVANKTSEASDWGRLMKWVTDEDLCIAQSVAARMASTAAHSVIQRLAMKRSDALD